MKRSGLEHVGNPGCDTRFVSEQQRLALEAAELGRWDYRFDTGHVFWDERCRAMFGVPDGAQIDYGRAITCIHPDFRAGVNEAVKAALAGANDGAYHREFPVCWPDGSIHWIASHGRVYFQGKDSQRRAVRFIGINQDITRRRKEEQELRRLNRPLRAHSSSDQAILRAHNEAEYVRDVCRIIVEDCGHAMAWIGYAENDERKTVRPVAYAGFDEGYINNLGVTWADTERGRGPTGTAIRTGQPCIRRNMLTDPRFEPWRAEACKRGYAASIAVPLMADGQAFGVLAIYCREPDPFTDQEVRLLCDLADDLAYGITALRLREEHAQAQALLEAGRHSLERERNLLQAVMNGARNSHLVYLDPQFNFVRVNEAYARGCGYTPDEMVGKNHFDLYPHAENEAIFARVRDTGEAVEFHDKPFVFPDQPERGTTYWDWTLVPVKDESGRVAGLVLSLVETTERKRAEEALRESEERARRPGRRARKAQGGA
jgi:PAS domain S-box-containing protein